MKSSYNYLFTYEEHIDYSRVGCIFGNLKARSGKPVNYHSFGIVDFAPSGSAGDLFKKFNLDTESVSMKIKELIK